MVALRRALAAVGLLAFAAMWGYGAAIESGWMVPCAVVFSAGDLLGAVAIARGWFWGRWLGLGIGLVGTLNMAVWLAMRGFIGEWFMLAQGIAFPSLLLLCSGRAMRAAFDEKLSPANRWRWGSGHARLLRFAMVANIAAAPMLLSYACIDPAMALGTRLAAIAAAAALAAAVALVIVQRSAGVLLMAAGGIATVAIGLHALPELLGPQSDQFLLLLRVTAVAAFPPGALAALATLALFARPIARFLRG